VGVGLLTRWQPQTPISGLSEHARRRQCVSGQKPAAIVVSLDRSRKFGGGFESSRVIAIRLSSTAQQPCRSAAAINYVRALQGNEQIGQGDVGPESHMPVRRRPWWRRLAG
jgi:hypothetical protein